jgi:ribonuclease E
MPKIMLINVTHAEESRVGIVTDGVLTSFEIESFSRQHLKGNIYKGVVHRTHPALEAAFVDIGADRDAFLPLDEICFRHLENPPQKAADNGAGRRRPRIQDLLKPGTELLVQITKEEFGNKPPTLSTFYSLPGRYLVLLPGSDDAGISRRIEGPERTRIRELIEKLHAPAGFGIIVRTAAGFDQRVRELERDLAYLKRLWENIQQTAKQKRAPALVYREHDLVLRNIRDYFTPDIDEIHIDNVEVFERAQDFLRDVMPGKEGVLHLYQGDKPLFSHFDVESQIESIYKRRVRLKSGGSIVIDGTEALTAIDVNSGRSIRGSSQEETAFQTNREAALEIARQLRLRDVGGLIVIDFIDMRAAQHATEVERSLRQAMREDKARHEVGRISHFGLMEISRQRLRPAAAATSYVACPMCEGHGLVRTTESATLVALRKVHNRIAQGDVAGLRLSLPSEVGLYLLNQKREDLAQLERRYGTRIQVALSAHLMPHQSEIEVRLRTEGATSEAPQVRLGGVTPAETIVPEAPRAAGEEGRAAAAEGTEPARSGRRRRRRRGGRRGAAKQAAAAIGEALSALGSARPGSSAEPSKQPPPTSASEPAATESISAIEAVPIEPAKAASAAPKRPRKPRRRRKTSEAAAAPASGSAAVAEPAETVATESATAARAPATPPDSAKARAPREQRARASKPRTGPKRPRAPRKTAAAAKTTAAKKRTSASKPAKDGAAKPRSAAAGTTKKRRTTRSAPRAKTEPPAREA